MLPNQFLLFYILHSQMFQENTVVIYTDEMFTAFFICVKRSHYSCNICVYAFLIKITIFQRWNQVRHNLQAQKLYELVYIHMHCFFMIISLLSQRINVMIIINIFVIIVFGQCYLLIALNNLYSGFVLTLSNTLQFYFISVRIVLLYKRNNSS